MARSHGGRLARENAELAEIGLVIGSSLNIEEIKRLGG